MDSLCNCYMYIFVKYVDDQCKCGKIMVCSQSYNRIQKMVLTNFLEYLGISYSGKRKHEQNIKNASLKRLQGTGGKALE